MNVRQKIDQQKEQLLNQVKASIKERATSGEWALVEQFLEIFWPGLVLEDWQYREVNDIAGCCYELWLNLANKNHTRLLKVCNPTLEEDGWLCNGTVIVAKQKDMPFLVDSLRLELNRRHIPIHAIKSTIIAVRREPTGEPKSLAAVTEQAKASGFENEAIIFLETGYIADAEELSELKRSLNSVLNDVETVVGDYRALLAKVDSIVDNIQVAKQQENLSEATGFLHWLKDSHFTFLGFKEFEFGDVQGEAKLVELPEHRLGLFKKAEHHDSASGDVQEGADFFYESDAIIAFSKSATRSTVHRPVYPDYIVIKKYDARGEVIGEYRILGLFTYAVYSLSPTSIPLLRQKVATVVARSQLQINSHDGKNLMRVIESFPRDELFQSDADTLFETLMGVARISERRVVRLFMRNDPFGKFVNCIAYVPRDIYNTRIRKKIEGLIGSVINSEELDSTTHFSESILARAYMVFRLADDAEVDYDPASLESCVVDITRGWDDRFESALIEAYGEAKGLRYHRQYANAFPTSYQEHFDARVTLRDIEMMEALKFERDVKMQLFHPIGTPEKEMRFKVMQLHQPLELSDVIPVLEHLGLRVMGEHPYQIKRFDDAVVWLHDFHLTYGLPVDVDVHSVSKLFEQSFAAVWHGKTESDGFNRLVLGARLHWREVILLRAYCAYMKQISFSFSADYIADTLANQLEITRNLVALFKAYFDPRINTNSSKSEDRIARLNAKILAGLNKVENLNEDKILRKYLELINASLRTNFYQRDANGAEKEYLSIKLAPREVPDMPEPKPLFEIFVYSPSVEGVHLRGAKVARGGLRWSDRLQDYRTEVLGLVKAQQVKNAVIVPSGAKGGFVAKKLPASGSRDEMQAEGIACYKTFIRGLLDLTDNYEQGELQTPDGVVAKDEADPYLVVAADKGTASFSDIANEISYEYGHWLGDGFASGGSQGYDHKKMAITAKGAWVCVQRHFRELGVNIQEQPFTCVGIGDMAGDVFGNGMLLSPCIKLVAAFNHQHIFIDPNPDPLMSFAERQRLFDLPRSSWSDYDVQLLSTGGGIFSRSAKTIQLSTEARQALSIEQEQLTPTELISSLLKAPVDLLWNGGIGTYVKAKSESNSDVGDKANDSLRVNGVDLRCKVVGEGGNLGMTQLARVEYALAGGACNTDFIDNSAGVDCSDHEVNIKILLDEVVAESDLTMKQRNQMLQEMTGAVAELVLNNNYRQSLALSIAQFQALARAGEYKRFIHYLENKDMLNRSLEFLPDDEQLSERYAKGIALTRPELAVLMAYAKVMLKDEFIQAEISSQPYVQKSGESAFPALLREKYPDKIYHHRLMNEIVATQVANDLINSLGIAAAHRLLQSTGATLKGIAVAYVMARDVFRMNDFGEYIQSLDNHIPAVFQAEIVSNMFRRVRRATRWFLANRKLGLHPEEEIEFFVDGIKVVNGMVGDALLGNARENWQTRCTRFADRNLDRQWVLQLAMPDNLFSGLSVVEVARVTGESVTDVATVFYSLYECLALEWFASELTEAKVETYWQAVARETFLDELELQMRNIVTAILRCGIEGSELDLVDQWLAANRPAVDRWLSMVEEVRSAKNSDFAMFSVALKELLGLAQAGDRKMAELGDAGA